MHRRWIVALAGAAIWTWSTGGAFALDPASVNEASFGRAPAQKSATFDPVLIKAQVLLDRFGYSPGEIDGRPGENARKAISEFARTRGLNTGGKLDARVWSELAATSSEPVLTEYTIGETDVQGPFLERLPSKMEAMKDLDRLAYRSPVEALAEKFHMSEALLKALNPGKSLERSGERIIVANVDEAPPGRKVKRVEIDKRQRLLRAFDQNGDLSAVFPASIGSADKPAPSGTLKVIAVARDPTYRYDPRYQFKGVAAKQPFTIKPGPNNPVGVVWIALSAKGYGIHGTPEPSKVSKTMSHGCIRLTNWDARKLAAMVEKGTVVVFLG
jgi:lipoprotein-anchoring transpeptidase ErfK/SrfK